MTEHLAPKFRIKICGVTTPADARGAAAAGADAVGINFCSQSPRFVAIEQAQRIVAALPAEVVRVGVFVNSTDDEVCRAFDHLQLDWIQLHGDEPPEFIATLGERPVIRAFRLGPAGLAPAVDYLNACSLNGRMPGMILVDAHVPGNYGGTGETADWDRLARERNLIGDVPLLLAGGLNPENVAQAIRHVRPDGVDTASGVEESPGRKDPQAVKRFVGAAAAALGES